MQTANPQTRPYSPGPRPTPISEWLNPRRRMNAETVLRYVQWHGGKVIFSDEAYADVKHQDRLDAYAVDTALDDLFMLGCVRISMAGLVQSVSILSGDIDRLAGQAGKAARYEH